MHISLSSWFFSNCFRHHHLLLYLVGSNECPVDEDDHNITYDNPIDNDDPNSFENPILESVHNITYENRIDKDDLNSFEHLILESDHNTSNEDSNGCPFGEDIQKDDNNMV